MAIEIFCFSLPSDIFSITLYRVSFINQKMKTFYLLTVLALSICFGSTNGYAQNGHNQTPAPIIITTNDPLGQTPRNPEIVPISGFVSQNSINLFFSIDLGSVSVTIEELSEGLLLSTVVNTSEGYAAIPFSGEPGSYRLFFYLSDGTEYIGSFCI